MSLFIPVYKKENVMCNRTVLCKSKEHSPLCI